MKNRNGIFDLSNQGGEGKAFALREGPERREVALSFPYGTLRTSPHYYNDGSHIEALLEPLPSA